MLLNDTTILVGGAHRQAVSEQGLTVEEKSLQPAGSTHQRSVTDGAHQLVDFEEATALKVSLHLATVYC